MARVAQLGLLDHDDIDDIVIDSRRKAPQKQQSDTASVLASLLSEAPPQEKKFY